MSNKRREDGELRSKFRVNERFINTLNGKEIKKAEKLPRKLIRGYENDF